MLASAMKFGMNDWLIDRSVDRLIDTWGYLTMSLEVRKLHTTQW